MCDEENQNKNKVGSSLTVCDIPIDTTVLIQTDVIGRPQPQSYVGIHHTISHH